MPDIDTWVVDHALAALADFRRRNPLMRFTVNLSAQAFESKRLTSQVKALLERYGLPGNSVVFEITERVAVRHLTDVDNQIAALKDLGCELAIDDFGAGYSSFSYLKRLPADYIKIDGEFIRDLASDEFDQTMVRLIAEVGAKAGMKTIAEYVENADSLAILAELGIDYAQGFFIGRPAASPTLPAEPVSLEKWRSARRVS
jgi:EAL domain-containing protein (putative c-di-GMP-specific phosphodiesterase class I)